MEIKDIFPEIEKIENEKLQEKVVKSLEKAINKGGWKEEDLQMIPFTLLIPELFEGDNLVPKITIVDHIRAVTQMCIATYERYETLGLADKLNKDELIAGGLLHDVGKFIEYERNSAGKIIQKIEGKLMRRQRLRRIVASVFELPILIRQAIVFHSKEGDKIPRLPEVDIIHRCDFLCFAPIKQIFENSN